MMGMKGHRFGKTKDDRSFKEVRSAACVYIE